MAHLNVNGIAVECSASEYELVRGGELVRSFNGQPRSTQRLKKKEYRFTTDQGGLLLDEAEALRALLEGEGHSWDFETSDLYSSRKLLPSSISSPEILSGDVAGKHSLGLLVEAGSSVVWPTAIGIAAWTMMFWRLESGTWAHYLLRRTALAAPLDVWRNTVKTDVSPGVLSVNGSGNLALNTFDVETLDDLVLLPYAVPTAWVSSLYSFREGAEWQLLPYVWASGPGVRPSSGLAAQGETGVGRRVPMRDGGTFTTGEVFDFRLSGA